jgi:hypothetical protein
MTELADKDAVCVFAFAYPDAFGIHMGSRYHEYDFHTETKGMRYVLIYVFGIPR